MEIIARWRARKDLESFEEAGKETSLAFKMWALVVGRKIGRTIRRNAIFRHNPAALCHQRACIAPRR
ncbi:MAG: hypothetical protein ABI769_07545 [Pseudomonadota bacterium]